MALVTYVLQRDFGSNKAGDTVSLEQEEAQSLVEAGVLAEATADDVAPEDDEEGVEPVSEAAVQRAVSSALKNHEAKLMKSVEALISNKGKEKFTVPATVKQPVVKCVGDLIRLQYKAARGNNTARNQLNAYAMEVSKKAPAGLNETTSSEGGYTVIPEWTSELFSKVKNLPRLWEMCRKETISGNTLNIPSVNETSLADGSRGGGIRSYWVGEGNTATVSQPAFTTVQAVIHTQVVLVPITNQLLDDNAYNLEAFISEKVGEEFVWSENYSIISGTGTTQPLGIMNQNSLITVTKESGQAAGSIVFPNLAKMWSRLHPGSRASAVWLANPIVYQQLVMMTFPGASGTASAFGGLTFNAADEFPLRIFGKPVLECMMCPDLGLPGDLILADLKQLYAVEHPGMEVAVSDQVYFTSLQTLYRFVRRYDVQSPWTAALTDFNSHYTYSPFVTISSRGT